MFYIVSFSTTIYSRRCFEKDPIFCESAPPVPIIKVLSDVKGAPQGSRSIIEIYQKAVQLRALNIFPLYLVEYPQHLVETS